MEKDELFQNNKLNNQDKHDASKDPLKDQNICSKADDESFLSDLESGSFKTFCKFLEKTENLSENILNKALNLACRRGYKFLVQKLVGLGANVQYKDTSGNTPLMICAENGFIDIVRFLLTRKADVNAVNSTGDSALILSICSSGSTEMVKVLLEQKEIDLNLQNRNGYTALMKAIEVKDIDTMYTLINRKNSSFVYDYTVHDKAVNSKGQTAQEIAEENELGNIFKIFNKCQPPAILHTIKTCDSKSLTVLLDCQLPEPYYTDWNASCAFHKILDVCKNKEKKSFNVNEVEMIKKLLNFNENIIEGEDVCLAVEAGNYDLVRLFLKYLVKKYPNWNDGRTLRIAAENGRLDLLKILLRYGVKDDREFNDPALHHALNYGHIDCAQLLLQHGFTLDIEVALPSTVKKQSEDGVKFLFQNFKQEARNYLQKIHQKSQQNILISAVKGGNLNIIGMLLDHGVDINRPTDTGVTALVESKNGEVAQFLIQRGADLHQMTEPIHFNCKAPPLTQLLMTREVYDFCTEEVVLVMLENGGSVKERDSLGKTPLLTAVRFNNPSLLQILLDHGADVCERDAVGNTALINAITYQYVQNFDFLLERTKEKGFLDAQNISGYTALILSALCKDLSQMFKIIKSGADVTIKDKWGNTVLHNLAMSTHSVFDEAVTELIKAGIDIHSQNNSGDSPLMLAARSNKSSMVKSLLDSGADVNAVSANDSNRTAMSYIGVNTFLTETTSECITYLLKNGASAADAKPYILFLLLHFGFVEVIPKLIKSGLPPSELELYQPKRCIIGFFEVPIISPLSLALLLGYVKLARYFMKNLFLTNSDVKLMCNKYLQSFLYRDNHRECLDFFDEISSLPLSLFTLTFVAVSSAVGTSPERENRVNLLPLPKKLKDKLLFKFVGDL